MSPIRRREPFPSTPTPDEVQIPPTQDEPTPLPDAPPARETVSHSPNFDKAAGHVIATGKANLSSLGDKFPDLDRHELNQLMFELERVGIIGPSRVGKSREILVSTWPLDAAPAEPAPEPEPAPVEPPHAEPEPAEPPPAEPEPSEAPQEEPPAEPTSETPATTEATTETPETPAESAPSPSKHWYEASRQLVVDAAKRFLSSFRGEVQPQEEKDYTSTWGDVGKNAAIGFLSVAASYGGVKIVHDLPGWLYQKYITNPAERKRIRDALTTKETELGKTVEPTAIEQKKATLAEAINASKFLTKERKEELLERVRMTVEEYETKDETLRTERNEKIAILLDEAIETRIKNTQIFKESLNTALMVSGMTAMRGVAYGTVAAYERYKKVAHERDEGTRSGSQFNEWIVKGFTETLYDLKGGGAETKIGKGLNMVKGATIVLRAAGFTHLAMGEIGVEGLSNAANPEVQFEKFINDLKEKGSGALIDNALAAWERIPVVGSSIKEFLTETSPTPVSEGIEVPPDTNPAETGNPASTEPFSDGSQELAPDQEVSKETIEKGLVKKGDGILKILERQDVSAKSGLEAAREAGIVRAGGDTRLTTEAIGRLSVFTETQPDGSLEIKFHDTQTGHNLSVEAARIGGFLYESDSAPVDVPETVVAEEEPVATPEAPAGIPNDVEATSEIPESIETNYRDDENVPNSFLNGLVQLNTDRSGNFESVNVTGSTLDEIVSHYQAALTELAQNGHAESDEVKFLRKNLELLNNQPADSIEGGVDIGSNEPLKRFTYKGETIRFQYDKDGKVTYALLMRNIPKPQQIINALNKWDLTPREVMDKFTTNHKGVWSGTSHPESVPTGAHTLARVPTAESDYQAFTKDITELAKREKLLQGMREEGLTNTLEFKQLLKQTGSLNESVNVKIATNFPNSK